MTLKIKVPVEVSGRFKLDVLGADGEVRHGLDWFDNLVLDTGLARMVAGGPGFNICRVGTGNSTPLPTDQALNNQIANMAFTSQSAQNSDVGGGFAWTRVVYEFPLGAVVGNVAEVGTGWHASNTGTLFSRALIKDAFGNPTTIPILDDEILRVTWEHRRYWPTEDFSGVIVNTGNRGGSYNWVARAADVGRWGAGSTGQCGFPWGVVGTNLDTNTLLYFGDSDLGGLNGRPSGTPVNSGSVARIIPTGGEILARARLSFTLAQGNAAGGLRCVRLMSYQSDGSGSFRFAAWQFRFDPAIPKTSEDMLDFDLEFTWVRRP